MNNNVDTWFPFREGRLPNLDEGMSPSDVVGVELSDGVEIGVPARLLLATVSVLASPEPIDPKGTRTPSVNVPPATIAIGTASFITDNGLLLTAAHVLPEPYLSENRLCCLITAPGGVYYVVPIRGLAVDRLADVGLAVATLPYDAEGTLCIPSISYLPISGTPHQQGSGNSWFMTLGYPQTENKVKTKQVCYWPRIYLGDGESVKSLGPRRALLDDGQTYLEGTFFELQIRARKGLSGAPVIAGPATEVGQYGLQVIGVMSYKSTEDPEWHTAYVASLEAALDLEYLGPQGPTTIRQCLET